MKTLSLLCLWAIAAAEAAAPPPYAIIHARVVTHAAAVDDVTIVMRDGRIAAIGPGLQPPADVRVFDAKGLNVYPGLIDAASHYGLAAPALPGTTSAAALAPAPASPPPASPVNSPDRYLRPQAWGVTPDVTTAARLAPLAQPELRRSYGYTTVLSMPREGQWQGSSALISLGTPDARGGILVAPVGMHVGFETRSARGSYPNSLMGVFAVLRQTLQNARRYRDTPASQRLYDPVSAALVPVLDGSLPVVFQAGKAEEIRRVLRFAQEFQLKAVIYGGAEAWRVADLLKERNVPVFVPLELAPATPEGSMFAAISFDDELPRNSPERIHAESNPSRLEKAGVRFALVTGPVEKIDESWGKLRRAISRGLTPGGALRALTLAPAEILGVQTQFGALEPGQMANFAIIEGDLFAAKPRVKAAVIAGDFHYTPPDTTPAKGRPSVPANPPQPSAAAAPNAQPPAQPEGARPGVPAAPVASQQRTQPTRQNQQPDPRQPLPDSSPDDPSNPQQAGGTGTGGTPIPERRPPIPEPAPADLVIRNATILTVTKGTITNGSVWVSGGKIREAGRTVAAPASAKSIDGTGLYVMPGIVDSHSHAAISGGVNEAGSSVTAQVRVDDVLNAEDVNLYRAAAGGVTTLNILHGSANVFGGQNATIKVRWGSPVERLLVEGAPRGIKMALGENPRRVNATAAAGRFPATRMGVAHVVRESFTAARDYRTAWNDYRARISKGDKINAPETNLALEVLADVLEGKVLVHAHCYRADEISMLLDLAEEFGFRVRTLQHVLEGYKVADKIRRHGAGASTFYMWGGKWEMFDGIPYNPAMLVRAGVRTAIHSDSDEIARRLNHEAAKAMRYGGLTETEALRLITADPAWMLGLEKRVGAIESGMDADLAIYNAHPFSPGARVEMTIVDGQIVFDRAKDLKHRLAWDEAWEPEPSGDASSSYSCHEEGHEHE